MRIAFICRSFPHHRPGGMEGHAHDLVAGLIDAGHEVLVVTTPLPREPALAPLPASADVLELGDQPAVYTRRFLLDFVRRAPAAVRRFRPQVVHAQGFAGIPAEFFLGRIAPVLTTIHGTLWTELPATPPWDPKRLRRHAFSPAWHVFLARARHLAVDSRFSARALRREALHLRARPAVVPLGFDLDRYPFLQPQDARRMLGIHEGALHLVALGRLEKAKNPLAILDAFICSAPGNAFLTIGGDGPQRAALEARRNRLAPRWRERVRLPGRVSQADLPALLASADLFLNADEARPAFGLSNAEALVMGTPVLTTPSGAHREVVRSPADGWIHPAIEWTDVLEAILASLPEPAVARKERARRARHRFARRTMIRRYERLYRQLDGS